MELHVHDPNRPWARPAEELREQGVIAQENLARLRDEEAVRLGVPPAKHDITVAHPARWDANHRSLIAIETIRGYTAAELHLRLHEVWGRYCLLRWLWERHEKPIDTDLAHVSLDAQPRCDAVLDAKHIELHALFWKIHFEQRRRIAQAVHRSDSASARDAEFAALIPATANGKPVERATDAELLIAACEHAGMLATLRWAMDSRRRWDDPALMEVEDGPFLAEDAAST